MKEVCTDLVTYIDTFGDEQYHPCGRPVKYKIKYNSHMKNKIEERVVCGIHCNSIKKYSDRMLKKMGYDIRLVVNKI